jgi:hypothetical protein
MLNAQQYQILLPNLGISLAYSHKPNMKYQAQRLLIIRHKFTFHL